MNEPFFVAAMGWALDLIYMIETNSFCDVCLNIDVYFLNLMLHTTLTLASMHV